MNKGTYFVQEPTLEIADVYDADDEKNTFRSAKILYSN